MSDVRIDDDMVWAAIDPKNYADDSIHDAFRWLRANNPLGRAEVEDFDPFWIVTKHADILEVSRNNDLFHNGDLQTTLTPKSIDQKIRAMTGGSPHLDCQKSAEFALPKPESVEQCTTQLKPADASSGTFTMSCKSEMVTGTGVGTYEVKDKSTATVKVSFKGSTVQGQPLSYDSSSVHKWIGSDCDAPPPGVDPSLAELMR